ncbi:MAG TPA: hypothetical protein VNG35_08190 [Gemmatimonadales bacterium]|nr:hypothetical protein [Gemmatimonadales bacterium]
MERRTVYLLGAGAALGAGAWWLASREPGGWLGTASQVVNDVLNAIVKGARLTRAPYDTTTGVVPGSPADLAASCGLDVETYSLARMISSEEGRSNNTIKAAVALATINYATRRGEGITALVTRAKTPAHSGSYGTQANIDEDNGGRAVHGPSDRYCSTALDPYMGDAEIAGQCISGQIADFTGGALGFDRYGQESDPDKVAANRAADGLVEISVPGIDRETDGIRFWGPA